MVGSPSKYQPQPWWQSLIRMVILVLLLCSTRDAHGSDQLYIKRGVFWEHGGKLCVTVGFRELFNSKLRQRLRSGFPTTVIMRMYLYRQEGDPPIAFAARTLKAVYDLWEEQFVLRFEEPLQNKTRRYRNEKAVIDRLTSFWRFPLTDLMQLSMNTKYFVAVIVEVNPMSEALLDEVRRWLRSPYSEHRPSSGESLFGSFVSIFVNNKIRSAEKTFRFRTQPFFRRP